MSRVHTTGIDRAWGGRGWLPVLLAVLACLVLTCLLSRGTSGGDEGAAMIFAADAKLRGWHAMLNTPNGGVRAHRLFWVAEKYLLDGFYGLVLPAHFYARPLVRNAVMTVDGSLFMLASAFAGWFFLTAKGHDWRIASLSVAALLLGSSAISFFTGGSIECMMCLFAILLTMLLDARTPLSRWQFAAALACGWCLIFCKEYSLLFLLPLALLLRDRTQRLWFFIAMLAAGIAWLGLLAAASNNHGGGTMGFYRSLLSVHSAGIFLDRVTGQLLSLAFGLVWCFPLLAAAALSWRKNRETLLIKSAAILLVILFLALFPFPYGNGAVAGPRYTVPYLLAFLPEVADGIALLRTWQPRLLLSVPLAVLLFLPAIDYRNSLISRWLPVSNRSVPWPATDVMMHPAVFAWHVVAAKHAHAVSLRPSRDLPYVVTLGEVFPMTGLSRIIYVLDNRGVEPDTRLPTVSAWLVRNGLGNPLPWRILRGLLILLLLGWLTLSALDPVVLARSAGKKLAQEKT